MWTQQERSTRTKTVTTVSGSKPDKPPDATSPQQKVSPEQKASYRKHTYLHLRHIHSETVAEVA